MIDSTQLLSLLMSTRGSQGWSGSALWPGNETYTYKLSLYQHNIGVAVAAPTPI